MSYLSYNYLVYGLSCVPRVSYFAKCCDNTRHRIKFPIMKDRRIFIKDG